MKKCSLLKSNPRRLFLLVFMSCLGICGCILTELPSNVPPLPRDFSLDQIFQSEGPLSLAGIDPGGTLYISLRDVDGAIYAVNPDTTCKWHFSTEGFYPKMVKVDLEGNTYARSGNNIFSINSQGNQKWVFQTENHKMNIRNFSIAKDRLYAVVNSGQQPFSDTLYSISTGDGAIQWTFSGDLSGMNDVVIGPEGTLYVIVSQLIEVGAKYLLYAIQADGTVKWTMDLSNQGSIYGIITRPDGTIFIMSSTRLSVVNSDGTSKWVFEVPSDPDGVNEFLVLPSIGTDGTIYIHSTYQLFALDAEGKEKWKYDFETPNYNDSPSVLGPDGTIYITSYSGLCAFSPDGTLKWQKEISKMSTCPTIGQDNLIYIVTGQRQDIVDPSPSTEPPLPTKFQINILNPDGTDCWTSPEVEKIIQPPVLGPNGTVYVMVNSDSSPIIDTVYAIRPK